MKKPSCSSLGESSGLVRCIRMKVVGCWVARLTILCALMVWIPCFSSSCWISVVVMSSWIPLIMSCFNGGWLVVVLPFLAIL